MFLIIVSAITLWLKKIKKTLDSIIQDKVSLTKPRDTRESGSNVYNEIVLLNAHAHVKVPIAIAVDIGRLCK